MQNLCGSGFCLFVLNLLLKHAQYNKNNFSFFKFYFMFYVHKCLCTVYSHGGQKRAPDHLELELEMVVGHHVASGDQTSAF